MNIVNKFCEIIAAECGGNAQMLDENNIVWRFVDGQWIGKRSVWTFDFRSCWLENTTIDNVKEWWCGRDSDYNEIFYNN